MTRTLLTWLLAASFAAAQCAGNGGNARLTLSTPRLGNPVTLTATGLPLQTFGVYMSGTLQVTPIPGVGNGCLSTTAPTFSALATGALGPPGTTSWTWQIPNDAFWSSVVIFLQAVVLDPAQASGLAISNTIRADFESPASAAPLTPLAPRHGWGCHEPRNDVAVVAGGFQSGSAPLSDVQVYSSLLRQIIQGPSMLQGRALHTTTPLRDGRVLIAGGVGGSQAPFAALTTVEIFDPGSWTIVPAAPMGTARFGHTAVALSDGRVLVAGGSPALCFTPVPGSIDIALSMSTNILINSTAEIYDPSTNAWMPVANAMQAPRLWFDAAVMPSGNILLVSGLSSLVGGFPASAAATATCDLFNPATASLAPGPPLPAGIAPRFAHRVSRMPDGSVLLTGGRAGLLDMGMSDTARLTGGTWAAGIPLPQTMHSHQQAVLPDGRVFILPAGISSIWNCGLFSDPGANVAFVNGWRCVVFNGFRQGIAMNDGTIFQTFSTPPFAETYTTAP